MNDDTNTEEARAEGEKLAANTTAEELKGDLQERTDEAEAKGYWGETPDPTPNSAYTLGGVTAGEPTPETDPKLRAEATEASEELAEELTPTPGQDSDNS
jgi:hypothetical protein